MSADGPAGKVTAFKRASLPIKHLALPRTGEVHLFFLDLMQLGSPLGQPDGRPFTPRAQRTARRFYLRLLLGAYLGLPGKDVHVLRAARGKPSLDPVYHDSDLQFSTAATQGHCFMGFTRGALIGVDLETWGRRTGNPLGLARRYFAAPEYEALALRREADRHLAFLHTWACKEAVVKAAGHGIANQLCRFEVSTMPELPAELHAIDKDDAAAWSLRVVRPADSHLAAVAVRHPNISVSGFSLRPALP